MKEVKAWIRVAHCDDIPLREGRAVKARDHEVAIFNLGNRFLAVENRCPHKGGPLADGIVSGATVICPLHAWKLSLETGQGVNAASGASCVETFSTRVEHGMIFVELDVSGANGSITDRRQSVCVEPGALSVASESNLATT